MKITHFVVNEDECIAILYQSEKFGRVVVFRSTKVNLEYPIEIYNKDTQEMNEKNIMDLVMEVLPV
jgi:hypothetical protein